MCFAHNIAKMLRRLVWASLCLCLTSGLAAAACVDGFNPKSGKSCGGSGDGGGEPETASCKDVYFGGAAGMCTAAGNIGDDCMLTRFNDNTPGWQVTQDCDLYATLIIPASDPIFDGNDHTFNLAGTWGDDGGEDYAAFTNGGGAVRIANLTISVASTAVANGCGGDTVQTAIWIDQDAPDSGVPRPQAGGVTIEASGGARFCNGIEYRGSDPQIRIPQFGGGVTGNTILENSYARAAIWLSDLNLTDNVKGQPKTWDFAAASDNVIEGSCGGSIGILYGPNVERGRIKRNLILPGGSGCGNAIGILVTDSGQTKDNDDGASYDFLAADPIIVEENDIETDDVGGSVGVIFDADSDATTGSNALIAGDSSDTGFCIEDGANVDLGNGKNADSFSGFGAPGNEIVMTGDCGVPSL